MLVSLITTVAGNDRDLDEPHVDEANKSPRRSPLVRRDLGERFCVTAVLELCLSL